MKSQVVSAAIVVLAGIVGPYVISVAGRVRGEFTTLGLDVVCAVWAATLSLSALGVFRVVRVPKEKESSVLRVLLIVVPTFTLSVWAWLTLTGRVISHGAMMNR
jgi:hypothetical protein